jgi:hypothetical protein
MPTRSPIGRRDRHLERVLGAVPVSRVLNEADHPLNRARWIVFKTERECMVE